MAPPASSALFHRNPTGPYRPTNQSWAPNPTSNSTNASRRLSHASDTHRPSAPQPVASGSRPLAQSLRGVSSSGTRRIPPSSTSANGHPSSAIPSTSTPDTRTVPRSSSVNSSRTSSSNGSVPPATHSYSHPFSIPTSVDAPPKTTQTQPRRENRPAAMDLDTSPTLLEPKFADALHGLNDILAHEGALRRMKLMRDGMEEEMNSSAGGKWTGAGPPDPGSKLLHFEALSRKLEEKRRELEPMYSELADVGCEVMRKAAEAVLADLVKEVKEEMAEMSLRLVAAEEAKEQVEANFFQQSLATLKSALETEARQKIIEMKRELTVEFDAKLEERFRVEASHQAATTMPTPPPSTPSLPDPATKHQIDLLSSARDSHSKRLYELDNVNEKNFARISEVSAKVDALSKELGELKEELFETRRLAFDEPSGGVVKKRKTSEGVVVEIGEGGTDVIKPGPMFYDVFVKQEEFGRTIEERTTTLMSSFTSDHGTKITTLEEKIADLRSDLTVLKSTPAAPPLPASDDPSHPQTIASNLTSLSSSVHNFLTRLDLIEPKLDGLATNEIGVSASFMRQIEDGLRERLTEVTKSIGDLLEKTDDTVSLKKKFAKLEERVEDLEELAAVDESELRTRVAAFEEFIRAQLVTKGLDEKEKEDLQKFVDVTSKLLPEIIAVCGAFRALHPDVLPPPPDSPPTS